MRWELLGLAAARGAFLFPNYVDSLAEEGKCLPSLEKEEPVVADEPLKDLLQRLADPSGRVVFTVFVNTRDRQEGRRFAAMMEKWMCRVRLSMGSSFLAFVDSEKMQKQFESRFGVSAYFSKAWIKEAFKGRGEGEKHDSNYWRWLAMESILRAGFSGLYVDTDVMWLADPRPFLDAGADFSGSCDRYHADGAVEWYNETLDWELLRQESAKHDDESICCQGLVLPVNAGIVFMRPSELAKKAVLRFRERVLSGPCWGQAAMHWALYELCDQMRCQILDPLIFASAGPLAEALSSKATHQPALPALIHLDVDAKKKFDTFFEKVYGFPEACKENAQEL